MSQPVVVEPVELVEEVVALSDVLLTLACEVEVEVGSGLVDDDVLVSASDEEDDDEVAAPELVSAGLSTKHADPWRSPPTAMTTAMRTAPLRRESLALGLVDAVTLSLAGRRSPGALS
jgi:hypothetical protein